MTKLSMSVLANHILAVATKSKLFVTNLQLQKIMFFALKYALRHPYICMKRIGMKNIKNMYNEPFLVWRYGPVIKSLYEKYRIYGSDPILQSGSINPQLNSLNDYIIQLLKKDPFDLVNKSHREPFWANNEHKIVGWRSNIAYSLYDVRTGK